MPANCEPWPGKRNSRLTGSPADERGPPREAPAERRDENEVSALQLAVARILVERDRNRRRARVPVAPDVVHAALGRNLQALADTRDDPLVRLMREEPAHIGGRNRSPRGLP